MAKMTGQAGILLLLLLTLTSIDAFVTKASRTKRKISMPSSPSSDGKDKDDFKIQTYNPLRLLVLKLGFTEPAWTSPWNYQKKQEGIFECAYCGQELFGTDAKYDSGSGWPSFWRSASSDKLVYNREWNGSYECSCSRCKSHLGHVFMDGPTKTSVDSELVASIPDSDPKATTRLPRFCINGASVRFEKDAVEKE